MACEHCGRDSGGEIFCNKCADMLNQDSLDEAIRRSTCCQICQIQLVNSTTKYCNSCNTAVKENILLNEDRLQQIHKLIQKLREKGEIEYVKLDPSINKFRDDDKDPNYIKTLEESAKMVKKVELTGFSRICDNASLMPDVFDSIVMPEHQGILQPLIGTSFQSLCCGVNVFMTLLRALRLMLNLEDIWHLCLALSDRDYQNYPKKSAEDLIFDYLKRNKLSIPVSILIAQDEIMGDAKIGNPDAESLFAINNSNQHFTLHEKE